MPVGAGTSARRSTATVGGLGMARIVSARSQPFRTVINTSAVLSFAGPVFRAVALGVFALHFALAIPAMVRWTVRWVGWAVPVAGEDPLAARRRCLTAPYAFAIERIRRTIPRDGEYLLVNGGTVREGGPLWVRFELAPRRARFLGRMAELPEADTLRRTLPPGPRWVVIAFRETKPPILMEREEFLRAREASSSHGGT
jgi:hypothetical protein